MASFATRARGILTNMQLKIPDKLKGGRLERFGGYFTNILNDYKAAVKDMVQDMRTSPKKTAFYLTLLTSGAVLAKTNPSRTNFERDLTECHHELLMLGDRIRNHLSDSHIQTLQRHVTEGTLRYTNCGLFSIVWLAGYDPVVDLYDAQCALVKPRWVDFHKQVVDVGVLGCWLQLRKAMQDYDVNPDEWDEHGYPLKPILQQG